MPGTLDQSELSSAGANRTEEVGIEGLVQRSPPSLVDVLSPTLGPYIGRQLDEVPVGIAEVERRDWPEGADLATGPSTETLRA